MAQISISCLILSFLTLLATPVAAQTVSGAPAGQTPAVGEVATGLDRALRMTVPVMINGQGPFDFVVDTGADRTVISEELAKQLNLPQTGTATLHAMGGSAKVKQSQAGKDNTQTADVDGSGNITQNQSGRSNSQSISIGGGVNVGGGKPSITQSQTGANRKQSIKIDGKTVETKSE